ncbi:MAG: sulfurtransferase [Pseudomonadales bacterium]|nr:sulfurtransferase [Pseudomonadales bacterium]NRA18797.1 sulfurtransferase [Oceanospirillaceae bacterium]
MYSTLITAQQLQQDYCTGNWIILDCRFDLADASKGHAEYAKAHIADAQYVHLNEQLAGAITSDSGRHPLPEIAAITRLFSELGIAEKTQVVVYDDCGGAMAARAWWLLQWLGHSNAAVLDGGINAWRTANYPLTSSIPTVAGVHFVRRSSDFASITTGQICSGSYQLVDARAEARFNGQQEPIDPVAGHVSGAINRPFSQNLTADGCFKTTNELQHSWQPLATDTTVHMCGSGVTACHNILAMKHAGFKASKLYVGSWSEWIRDPARSVARIE